MIDQKLLQVRFDPAGLDDGEVTVSSIREVLKQRPHVKVLVLLPVDLEEVHEREGVGDDVVEFLADNGEFWDLKARQ